MQKAKRIKQIANSKKHVAPGLHAFCYLRFAFCTGIAYYAAMYMLENTTPKTQKATRKKQKPGSKTQNTNNKKKQQESRRKNNKIKTLKE